MTFMRGAPGLSALTFVLVLGTGFLQSGDLTARPALTGTGGGPETTITAPYTAPTGQTLPPGSGAAPMLDPSERTERQRNLDRVLDGICDSCR